MKSKSKQAKNLKQWTDQWLDEHKDNPKALSNVILTFTGSAAIASPIVFQIGVEVQSIYPHTCSNSVDVPIDIDKESLRASLDAWSEEPEIDVTKELRDIY